MKARRARPSHAAVSEHLLICSRVESKPTSSRDRLQSGLTHVVDESDPQLWCMLEARGDGNPLLRLKSWLWASANTILRIMSISGVRLSASFSLPRSFCQFLTQGKYREVNLVRWHPMRLLQFLRPMRPDGDRLTWSRNFSVSLHAV